MDQLTAGLDSTDPVMLAILCAEVLECTRAVNRAYFVEMARDSAHTTFGDLTSSGTPPRGATRVNGTDQDEDRSLAAPA